MIGLIKLTNYLLDQQLRQLEAAFVTEGGLRERMTRARLAPACALAGIDASTLRRWTAGDGLLRGDRRPDADRPIPSHALSEAEQARIIEIANEPRFAEIPSDLSA